MLSPENQALHLQFTTGKEGDSILVKTNGLVLRYNFQLQVVQFLEQTIDLIKGCLAKEEKEEEKEERLSLRVSLKNSVVDVFPFYQSRMCREHPEMFEFKSSDLDKSKKENTYFANNRSVLCLGEVILEQGVERALSLSCTNLNYFLVHLNDFNYASFPVLFLDPDSLVSDYYDGFLESLAFVNILGINALALQLLSRQPKRLALTLDDVTLNVCRDSLKKLSKHIDFVKLTH